MQLEQFNPSLYKGSPSNVGLPLDVIKNTGDQMYARYTENRAKAFNIETTALNLPDAGNANNKKIIQNLGDSIKTKFKEYQDEDKWWEADKAVVEVAKELATSPIVKDLQTHAALRAKVDKDIDDSKAPEYYKNLQRLYNQKTYKGIRDQNGNALNYTGTSISSMDLMGKYKEYQELAKGFEADMNTYIENPTQTTIDNASDGFKYAINHFGTTKIKEVSKDEINNYLRSIITNDPEFTAITQDIARLDLFAKKITKNPNETNFSATIDDVKELYDKKAMENPLLAKLAIISSPNYINMTKGMTSPQKQVVLNKILSDKNAYLQYYTEGRDYELNNTKVSPDDIYYNFYKNDAYRVIDGMADKYSYRQVDRDVQNIVDPTTNARFSDHLKQQQGQADLVTPVNTINIPNVSAHIELRDQLLNDMDKIKVILSDNTVSEDVKAQKRYDLDMIQGKFNANELVLRGLKDAVGMNDKDLIDKSKDKLLGMTGMYLNPNVSESEFGPFKDAKYSNQEVETVFNTISKNIDLSNIDLANEIFSETNKRIDPTVISTLRNKYNEELKHNTDKLLRETGGDHLAINVHAVGSMGADKTFYSNAMTKVADMFSLGNGDFEMVTSPNNDMFKNIKPGSTNAGLQHIYTPASQSKNATTNPIKMELAFAGTDDTRTANGLLLNVIETLSTGEKTNYLVRYKGNDEFAKQIMYNVLDKNTRNANKENSPTKLLSAQASKYVAGYLGGSVPATKIINSSNPTNSQKLEGATLSYALENIKEVGNNGLYEDVEAIIDLSNGSKLPIVVKTVMEDGFYHQAVYDAINNQKIAENFNGKTPNAILEAIGSRKAVLDYGPKSEMGQQLMKLFNIDFDGNK